MRTSSLVLIAATLLGPATVGAQMGMGRGMGPGGGMGMMGGSPIRRAFVMHNGIEPKYSTASNPLPRSTANLQRGRTLFEQNCAACHGAQGRGDGPAGKSLNPPPASLIGLGRMGMATDGYLDWTISEGGVPIQTAMPPFKGALKQDDIWALILFLRTL